MKGCFKMLKKFMTEVLKTDVKLSGNWKIEITHGSSNPYYEQFCTDPGVYVVKTLKYNEEWDEIYEDKDIFAVVEDKDCYVKEIRLVYEQYSGVSGEKIRTSTGIFSEDYWYIKHYNNFKVDVFEEVYCIGEINYNPTKVVWSYSNSCPVNYKISAVTELQDVQDEDYERVVMTIEHEQFMEEKYENKNMLLEIIDTHLRSIEDGFYRYLERNIRINEEYEDWGVIQMGESLKLFQGSVSVEMYEDLKSQLDLLKEVCEVSVAERIKTLEEENKILTSERDTLRGRVEESDSRLKEVKKYADQIIKDNNKKHEDGRARQAGVWEGRVRELDSINSKLESEVRLKTRRIDELEHQVQDKDIRIAEVESLLKSRCEEIERLQALDIKLDTVLEIVINTKDKIELMINKNCSGGEIIDTLEKMTSSVTSGIDYELIEEECRKIHELSSKGYTDKDIGKMLWPELKQSAIKVLKRRRSPSWKKIFGDASKQVVY